VRSNPARVQGGSFLKKPKQFLHFFRRRFVFGRTSVSRAAHPAEQPVDPRQPAHGHRRRRQSGLPAEPAVDPAAVAGDAATRITR
jgi:hypothetical protein